jgi:hypothetical protein
VASRLSKYRSRPASDPRIAAQLGALLAATRDQAIEECAVIAERSAARPAKTVAADIRRLKSTAPSAGGPDFPYWAFI